MRDQIIDGGGMNINAGDRAAFELPGARLCRRQRATRRPRSLEPGRETLGCGFPVFRVEQCSEDDNLVGEFATEKISIVTLDTGPQIGERKRWNIVAAPLEIQSQRIRHRAWNEIAGKRHASVFRQRRFGL